MVFSVAEVAEEAADGSQAGHCGGPRADSLPVAQDLRQRVLALAIAHQSQHMPQDVVRQQAQQRAAALPAKRTERPQIHCNNVVVIWSRWSQPLSRRQPFGKLVDRAMEALMLAGMPYIGRHQDLLHLIAHPSL